MTVQALQAAHDAGYLHGLRIGIGIGGVIGMIIGFAIAMLRVMTDDGAPDANTADGFVREDRVAQRHELPPVLPSMGYPLHRIAPDPARSSLATRPSAISTPSHAPRIL